MNNITKKLGKMSYTELAEFSCWLNEKSDYLHIVFPYDDTLSVRGTTIVHVNGKNRQELIPSISLSASLYITLLSSSRS